MMANDPHRRARRALLLLLVVPLAGCKPARDLPPPPQAAEPAPLAAAPVAEDRGRKQGEQPAATPAADQSAFSHVDSGEAERAASQRGHDSAGEQSPAARPGSGS